MKKSKYIKIGSVAVDSSNLMIVDPSYVVNKKLIKIDYEKNIEKGDLFIKIPLFDGGLDNKEEIPCRAIVFGTRGDGLYEIFGKIEHDKHLGEILTEIKIKIT